MNYRGIYQLLTTTHKDSNQNCLLKSTLKDILLLAQSRRERELICYTAKKSISGNLTQTSAKKHLGLLTMNQRILDVERCISEVKLIHETIKEMAQAEIDSLTFQDSYSDSSCSEDAM